MKSENKVPSNEATSSFVHLHVHTQYSLLQGMIRIAPLVERVKQFGMPAVAITDTHSLFGAVDFYLSAKASGVHPIIGAEVRVKPIISEKGPAYGFPLVLICKNETGYQNLSKLLSESYLSIIGSEERQRESAQISRDLLSHHLEGLVVLSGGIKSELSTLTLHSQEDSAKRLLQWFQDRIGENYFLEIQDHGLPEQTQMNSLLTSWGERLGIGLVATNQCHYLDKSDAHAQEVLQSIELGRRIPPEDHRSLAPAEFDFKSSEEMVKKFESFPGAISNTKWIAEKAQFHFKMKTSDGKPIYHLPTVKVENVNETFRKLSHEGLEKRLAHGNFDSDASAKYRDRLNLEIEMIERTGFVGYFLVVADFIGWAKAREIPVGPGRGSGAGSLVAYALEITDIDPIAFNLLFERFINPDRVSLPDFDIDFCPERRAEVINYVSQKYGKDCVAQIITFGKLQARAVVKDVGRVYGLNFSEMDQITKLFPDELNITLADALEKEAKLREKSEQDAKIGKVIETSLKLEGLGRSAGIHAAGVIITDKPIMQLCPLYVGRDDDVVVQFDKDMSEKIGLVKFDFLGLKTLTVISEALKLIDVEDRVDFSTIGFSDPKVYELICKGDTNGIFQLESSGMKDLCMRLKPETIDEITAISALYRPGPLGSGMVDDFVACKHGNKAITYEDPRLEPILKETYGVMLYQEQVMSVARELAGYSLGQADLLRRAMGKKKAEEMAKNRELFVKGAGDRNVERVKAERIFDLMAKFAEYGFNKSHSAAYALITYQTAYLKAHFPAEFYAALMTTEMGSSEKLGKYIQDARAHQIPILPPDVLRSGRRFSVEKLPDGNKAIRFGLEGIKGVGSAAVDSIIDERRKVLFESLPDMLSRVSTRKINKKVLESLVLAGALDEISKATRAAVFESIEDLLESAGAAQEEKEMGQDTLFDAFKHTEVRAAGSGGSAIRDVPEWVESRKLAGEKQVLGLFLSAHPMSGWQSVCESWLGASTNLIVEKKARTFQANRPGANPYQRSGPTRQSVRLAGIISDIREIRTKKGTKMAFASIEDLHGKLELVLFPDVYEKQTEVLARTSTEILPLFISGEIEPDGPKILVSSIDILSEGFRKFAQKVVIDVGVESLTSAKLRNLKSLLLKHRGRCPVGLLVGSGNHQVDIEADQGYSIQPTSELFTEINRLFGGDVVKVSTLRAQ